MTNHVIESVSAVAGAIDRLDWRVRISTDFHGTWLDKAFAFGWCGVVAFDRKALQGGSIPGPNHPRLVLNARWLNQMQAARMNIPGTVRFEFTTELPAGVLDRIERFREAGRLFARVEGDLLFTYRDGHNPRPEGSAPWLSQAVETLSANSSIGDRVITDAYELTRDFWCEEVLHKLKPPGHHVIEIQIPTVDPANSTATRVLRYLDEAQRSFNEGRWAEVARVCYRALEEFRSVMDPAKQAYGEYACGQLLAQAKEVRSLCNPERHAERGEHDGLEFDRNLALHVLVSTQSLAGVVLR